MEYLCLLFDITVHHNIIGFLFGFSEYDGSAMFTTVHKHNITNHLGPLVEWTVNSQVLDILVGLIAIHCNHIYELSVLVHIFRTDIIDPLRHCG